MSRRLETADLQLISGNFTDLNQLAGLTQLTSLSLVGCKQISNFGALAGMTQLVRLDLAYIYREMDWHVLTGLDKLKWLRLSGLIGEAIPQDIRKRILSIVIDNTRISTDY